MTAPTRQDVAYMLSGLLAKRTSRQAASEWACQWILNDEPVADQLVWKALELLGAADLISTDRPFLYTDADFRECLDQLRSN